MVHWRASLAWGRAMKSNCEEVALQIWNDVLKAMPAEYHQRHALVEARRQIAGMSYPDAVYEALDRLAVEAFGADQLPSSKAEELAPFAKTPEKSSEDEIRRLVEAAVSDGFAATTDGSLERAEILKRRGLENASRVIEEYRSRLSWFARRRLRAAARKAADREMRVVIGRGA